MESYNTNIILLNVPKRRNWWLLFGRPDTTSVSVPSHHSDSSAEILTFSPGAVFGLSRQTLNDYGIVEWEMLLLRAVRPGENAHVIPGVRPGAELLLFTHGKKKAQLVKCYLDLFDAYDVDPVSTPDLHRRAAPFLRKGMLPEQLVRTELEKRRAG